MKKILLTAMGLLALTLTVHAGKFEDFDNLFEGIVDNFKEAQDAEKGSRLESEYEKQLSNLALMARDIQLVVTKLKIEDVNLPREVNRLKEVYVETHGDKKHRRSTKRIGDTTGKWNPIHKLRQQIQVLKKLKFSYEKESIEGEIKEQTGLKEFESLLNQYTRHIQNMANARTNSTWRRDFEKKLSRFKALGRDIQTRLVKENVKINVSKEVIFLSDAYKQMTRYKAEKDKEKKNDRVENLETDIMVSVKKLRGYIAELKDMDFALEDKDWEKPSQQDQPQEEQERPEPGTVTANELMKKSSQELLQMLQKERDRIYKASRQLTGFDQDTVDEYLMTLSKSQQKRFGELVDKYRERNYQRDQAQASALMEIHGILRNNLKAHKKAEMVEILAELYSREPTKRVKTTSRNENSKRRRKR